MFFAGIPYSAAIFSALSRWPLTSAVTLHLLDVFRLGARCCIEMRPSPTIANPILCPPSCARPSCAAAPNASPPNSRRVISVGLLPNLLYREVPDLHIELAFAVLHDRVLARRQFLLRPDLIEALRHLLAQNI